MNVQNPDIKIRYIKTKNKTRRITTYVSDDCNLRLSHSRINDFLKESFIPSVFTKAYVSGCSIYHNALSHLYNDCFVMMDIKDFFSSISHRQLEKKLHHEINAKAPNQISMLECRELVNLCSVGNVGLPLGFITSPVLSNIYLKEFDGIFYGKLKTLPLKNIIYTRYADDIVVSFKQEDVVVIDDAKSVVINIARQILSRYNLHLNERKTRFYSLGISNHVRITGVNITKNDKGKRLITVGRSLKNKLYWDTINYMESDNKNAETVNHIKGLQSFILSIEKNGYEKCYSNPMIENVRKYGFRTLKDLIDSL